MYESEIRKIFKEYSYLLNDVAGIKFPKGKKSTNGFHHRSIYSCDNIVLWMICHDTPQKATGRYGTTTGYAISTVREIIRRYIKDPNLKFIGRGRDRDPDPIRGEIHERKREFLHMGDNYIPGYIAIKVSLSETAFPEVHEMLTLVKEAFEQSYIVLHDIDIFVDCGGITNREFVQEYLLDNDVSIQSIVNDRIRVGDDCISWMVEDNKRRNKIYNKYIQMLQSCDVRKAIGSIIADLVYNPDDKFTNKLKDYKKKGMCRVESTFYSGELQPMEYYINKMKSLLEFLEGCTVYYVDFEKQWIRLSRKIHSSFAIYITNKKIFAYSHWWNSITGKIQGYSRSKVSECEIEKLLANYSFNDRPMYYLRGNLLEDGSFKVDQERTYHRDDNSTAITLVPGIGRGLYPSFAKLEKEYLSFKDVGIVSYKNITIDWPKKVLKKHHRALVDITWDNGIPTKEKVEETSSSSEKEKPTEISLKEINISSTGKFRSANSLAKEGIKRYTIIKYGYREFYGSSVIHLVSDDGTKIRCTKRLQSLVEEKISQGIPFQIELTRAVKIQGYNDVHCRLIED